MLLIELRHFFAKFGESKCPKNNLNAKESCPEKKMVLKKKTEKMKTTAMKEKKRKRKRRKIVTYEEERRPLRLKTPEEEGKEK